MKHVVLACMFFVGCASAGAQRNIASASNVVVIASGFVCQGPNLYSAAGLITSNFNYASDCQAAVNQSKNGFICQGPNMYSASGLITSNFNYASDCQAAVNASK